MQYPFLFLLIIGLSLLQMTDACGKRPSKTTPAPITTMSPNATTPEPSYKLPCNKTETRLRGCLHGGSCFVIIIRKTRHHYCQCPEDRIGNRCEMLDPESYQPFVDPNKLRTAHIAAGAVGTVIVVLVIVGSVYVYMRVKKKKPSLAHRHRQNGSSTHANAADNHEETQIELEAINQIENSKKREYV